MASEEIQSLQGMDDIAPPDVSQWQSVESVARRTLDLYGYQEIRTPLLEHARLFTRSLGDATDVVQKEMYRFEDRGGRDVALRQEGTAGVMRYIASKGTAGAASRLYYIGPMFRAERPQAGRKRQFHQLGTEDIGPPSPAADAECIALQMQILSAWGLNGCRIHINTRGDSDDQQRVAEGLTRAVLPLRGELCDDCRQRFDRNILRILDCKNASCRQILESIPPVTEFMGAEALSYLQGVQELLGLLDIEATPNPLLVRGLDYYEHTVWEITHASLGAQASLCGGGRFRFSFGKNPIQGVGFGMGLERVIHALNASGVEAAPPRPLQVYIVTQHPSAFRENLVLAQTLRLRGVVIRGEQEMDDGTFLLKDMTDGSQEALSMPDLLQRLTSLLSIQ